MIFANRYGDACGPAVVASARGITRVEAAIALLTVRFDSTKGHQTTDIYEIADVMGVEMDQVDRQLKSGYERHSIRSWQGQPVWLYTLAQWLRSFGDREAILRASRHFLHVNAGRIVEANGQVRMRARVTHTIWLDQDS